jgi:hypothetical protein
MEGVNRVTLSVEIGQEHPTARFHSPTIDSFGIELVSDGLTASRFVYVHSFDLDALAGFFEDLADSWKGWDGEKSWRSIEHELLITATSDALGHCLLTFTLRDGPNDTWKTTVSGFTIGAGEDMAVVAREMRAWAGSA